MIGVGETNERHYIVTAKNNKLNMLMDMMYSRLI